MNIIIFATALPDGVTGNTSDSESEESRFDPWSGNKKRDLAVCRVFFFKEMIQIGSYFSRESWNN